MSRFNKRAPSMKKIKTLHNVGCMLDIPTGTYHKTELGNWALCGGTGGTFSIAGPGNSFKTTITVFINLILLARYRTDIGIYDSENSYKYQRLQELASKVAGLEDLIIDDSEDNDKVVVTQASDMWADEYFEMMKEVVKEIIKDKKATKVTSPFLDGHGERIKDILPWNIIWDSLSNSDFTELQDKIVDKNQLGDSANLTMYMRGGLVKKQLITQLANLAPKGGAKFSMVAHVGDEFDLGMMTPKKHKLTFSKKGSKITGVTKAFDFINELLLEIQDVGLLLEGYKKGVKYPLTEADRGEDARDLLELTVVATRNKSGQTGTKISWLLSQREGLLPHLSMFRYVKDANFGIDGNVQTYQLALVPEINLSRTKVRGKINENYCLRRALEIQSEMKQMQDLWVLPDHWKITPQELYSKVKAAGYNWEELLNDTRGYWVYKEHAAEETKKELSTADLLDMAAGKYHPYWMPKDKKTARK